MSENPVIKSLDDECLAYMKYAQQIHPTHVKNMIEKAYEAGKAEQAEKVGKYKEALERIGTKKHVGEGYSDADIVANDCIDIARNALEDSGQS